MLSIRRTIVGVAVTALAMSSLPSGAVAGSEGSEATTRWFGSLPSTLRSIELLPGS